MLFTISIRQGPARMASRLPQLAKSVQRASSNPSSGFRAFHQTTPRNTFFSSRTSSLSFRANTKPTTNLVSRLTDASRTYYQEAAPPRAADQASLLRKLLVGGAIFGGTLVAINVVFNRETREDGGMPPFERSYLNSTFLHTGLGIGIIALSARQMIQSGFVYRIMVTSPWVVAIGGLGLSFATMLGTRAIDPDK